MALHQDVTMSERALRIEAHHVDGSDPSLAYVAVYSTDDRGQWMLLFDWTFGAFSGHDTADECKASINGLVSRLLR